MTQAVYLFGLTCADRLEQLQQLTYHDNSLLLHSVASVLAIYTWVPLTEFCGTEAETRMQDLAWLLPRAQYHEQVIRQAMQYSPVLPTNFATLFSNLASLENYLSQHTVTITQFLLEITNKQEWAVKGLLNRSAAITTLVNQQLVQQSTQLANSPGKRYFQERQFHRQAEQQLQGWLKQVCGEIATDLAKRTSRFTKRRVWSPSDTDTHQEIIVNWAFLLSSEQLSDFLDQIKRINAQYAHLGLSFEYSGPWAPYSFSKIIGPPAAK